MEQEVNKFNEVELLMGGFFTLGVDVACIVLDLTGVGAVITPVIQAFVTFSMWMWFRSKGDTNSGKLGRQIAKYFSNFIPILPTTFIAFIVEAFIHNHPKLAAATGQVAGAAVGAAVGGPAGAKVGQAVGGYAMGQSATDAAGNAAMPTKVPLKKAA